MAYYPAGVLYDTGLYGTDCIGVPACGPLLAREDEVDTRSFRPRPPTTVVPRSLMPPQTFERIHPPSAAPPLPSQRRIRNDFDAIHPPSAEARYPTSQRNPIRMPDSNSIMGPDPPPRPSFMTPSTPSEHLIRPTLPRD